MMRCLLVLLLVLLPSRAWAEGDMPLITVTGRAEILVMPDCATIDIGVHTFDTDLTRARVQNDERMSAIIAAARTAGIKPENLRTNYVSLQPRAEDRREGKPSGFTADNSLVITVHDLKLVQPLLAALFKAGANTLDGVHFSTTRLRTLRDEARRMALKAAREKATDMAAQLDARLGTVWSINEGSGRSDFSQYQNVSSREPSSDVIEGTVVPGSLSVTADVVVRFQLISAGRK